MVKFCVCIGGCTSEGSTRRNKWSRRHRAEREKWSHGWVACFMNTIGTTIWSLDNEDKMLKTTLLVAVYRFFFCSRSFTSVNSPCGFQIYYLRETKKSATDSHGRDYGGGGRERLKTRIHVAMRRDCDYASDIPPSDTVRTSSLSTTSPVPGFTTAFMSFIGQHLSVLVYVYANKRKSVNRTL